MKAGFLFEGIGGFSLGAQASGIEVAWVNEVKKSALRVIRNNLKTKVYDCDIRSFEPTERVDILCGGDPCQGNSWAGLGKGESDNRFLWPEMFRIIKSIGPRWIVNENVYNSISNGIVDRKIDDLESEGYACWPISIAAESVGALHQRERVFIIAYNPNGYRSSKEPGSLCGAKAEKVGRMEEKQYEIHQSWESVDIQTLSPQPAIYENFNFGSHLYGEKTYSFIESRIMGMLDGLPIGMDYPDRHKRIDLCGNAVVPQLAYEIFKIIIDYERIRT